MRLRGTDHAHIRRCKDLMQQIDATAARLRNAASCHAGYDASLELGVLAGRADAAAASLSRDAAMLESEAMEAIVAYTKRCARRRP